MCRDADLPSCSPSGYRNGRPGKIRTVRQKPHFASEDRSWGAITPKGSSPSISTNFPKFLNVPPARICGQRRLAWLEVVREPPPRRHPGGSNPPLSLRSEPVDRRRCVSSSVYRESAANWPVRGADFKPSPSPPAMPSQSELSNIAQRQSIERQPRPRLHRVRRIVKVTVFQSSQGNFQEFVECAAFSTCSVIAEKHVSWEQGGSRTALRDVRMTESGFPRAPK